MHAVNYSSMKVLHHYIFKVHILKKIKIKITRTKQHVSGQGSAFGLHF